MDIDIIKSLPLPSEHLKLSRKINLVVLWVYCCLQKIIKKNICAQIRRTYFIVGGNYKIIWCLNGINEIWHLCQWVKGQKFRKLLVKVWENDVEVFWVYL